MFFFFQAEDGIRDLVRSRGIRDLVRSRGLGDVYKRQALDFYVGVLGLSVDFIKDSDAASYSYAVFEIPKLSLIHI